MSPNAGGDITRPSLRNPGELNYQVGSQSDQNEYVSQAHDAYGGMPPPINPHICFEHSNNLLVVQDRLNPKLQYQALAWLTQEFLRLKQPSWLLC